MELPSLATIVVPLPLRAWNHPGIVESFVHVTEPEVGSVSKSCVYATSIVAAETGPATPGGTTPDASASVPSSANGNRMETDLRIATLTSPHGEQLQSPRSPGSSCAPFGPP